MPRLIHLNGPPGIGKSTVARRYVAEHPGVLCLDIDVLRSWVGGWQHDFVGVGALVRPAALALIETYLAGGHDVVLPQMLIDPVELERFHAAARTAGADVAERFLLDSAEASVRRFHARGSTDDVADPWHAQVRDLVARDGGDDMLRRCHADLTALLAQRPHAVAVSSRSEDVDGTYAALLASL